MSRNGSKLKRGVRWSYELLFSLYVANFVVNREAVKAGSKFLDWLAVPLISSDLFLSHWRGGHRFFPQTHVRTELYFGVFCFLALILFVCLRLLSQIPLAGTLLAYPVAGAIVVGPFLTPVFESPHLQSNGLYEWTDEGHLHVFRWLEVAEVLFLLSLVGLWRLRQWPAKTLALVLAVHFVFWSLIIAGQDWPDHELAVYEYLLLPFAAGVLWVMYAKLSAGSMAIDEPARHGPEA